MPQKQPVAGPARVILCDKDLQRMIDGGRLGDVQGIVYPINGVGDEAVDGGRLGDRQPETTPPYRETFQRTKTNQRQRHSWHGLNGWAARISINGKIHCLGTFPTRVLAAAAFSEAAEYRSCACSTKWKPPSACWSASKAGMSPRTRIMPRIETDSLAALISSLLDDGNIERELAKIPV
jgi:hypothetical protein